MLVRYITVVVILPGYKVNIVTLLTQIYHRPVYTRTIRYACERIGNSYTACGVSSISAHFQYAVFIRLPCVPNVGATTHRHFIKLEIGLCQAKKRCGIVVIASYIYAAVLPFFCAACIRTCHIYTQVHITFLRQVIGVHFQHTG